MLPGTVTSCGGQVQALVEKAAPGEPRADEIPREPEERSAIFSADPHFWRLGLLLPLQGQPVEPAARRRFLAVRSQVQETSRAFFQAVLGEFIADGRRERVLARYFMAVADGIFIAAQAEGLGDPEARAGAPYWANTGPDPAW